LRIRSTHMASLTSLTIACVFVLSLLSAQDVPDLPVPIWPEGGVPPSGQDGRYVYLTQDRHTIVVLVPEDPEIGIKGPKKSVRVPLRNDLKPVISVSLDRSGGLLSCAYSIRNRGDARDAVGKFGLVVPAQIDALEVRHQPTAYRKPWGGTATRIAIASQPLFPWVPRGRYVYWYRSDHNVIPPGEMLDGFKLISSKLPGFTTTCVASGELVNSSSSTSPGLWRYSDNWSFLKIAGSGKSACRQSDRCFLPAPPGARSPRSFIGIWKPWGRRHGSTHPARSSSKRCGSLPS